MTSVAPMKVLFTEDQQRSYRDEGFKWLTANYRTKQFDMGHLDGPAYSPQGGYSGLEVTTYIGKRFNQFRLNLFTRADFLNGAVFSDSPLVKTSTSILAGFTIAYFFWESRTLVEADK
jgi:hypothetical protein